MGNKPKIIIVDDDNELHLLYKSAYKKPLNEGQFTMLNFLEAEECLAYLDKEGVNDPMYLFSDLMMPVMNGFELVEKIKQKYPQVKVWIVSSFEEPEHIKKAKELGVNAFLSKPLNSNTLLKIIEEYK